MKLFFARWSTKRRVVTALLVILPLLLFAVIRERQSWLPRTFYFGKSGDVGRLVWAPDGKSLVVSTAGKVQVWDTERMLLLRSFKIEELVGGIRFTPSGLLACETRGRGQHFCGSSVDLWDFKKGSECWRLMCFIRVHFLPMARASFSGNQVKKVHGLT